MGKKPDARQIGIIAFAVIAVLIAVVVIFKTVKASQPDITKVIDAPPGSSVKLQAMKAQKEQGDQQDSGKAQQRMNPNSMGR